MRFNNNNLGFIYPSDVFGEQIILEALDINFYKKYFGGLLLNKDNFRNGTDGDPAVLVSHCLHRPSLIFWISQRYPTMFGTDCGLDDLNVWQVTRIQATYLGIICIRFNRKNTCLRKLSREPD